MFLSDEEGALEPLVGGDATLSKAAQRAFKKHHVDRGELPASNHAYAHEAVSDWSDIMEQSSVVWQRMFDDRTKSQRKKASRRLAKAARVGK